MTTVPNLLNDDGSASMATALMMSHHGLRRDLAHFEAALRRLIAGDGTAAPALREEWGRYRATLHGHHQAEDNGLFPSLRAQQPPLAAIIDGLDADHRRIDPLLEEGDRVFAELPATATAAAELVSRLRTLLSPHLATEETHLIPFLRAAKQFPPPGTEAELAMYADGFAWSFHGVAPDVVERVCEILPAALVARLPAARATFEQRCVRVWGSAKAGASRTPVPEGLGIRAV